jgi:serine/threonine protein phosphatase 1
MKYFVVSDIHAHYDELIQALKDAGWFEYKGKKKLIICGDMMDRGPTAKQLQEFILELMDQDLVILVKGNHETLMMNMLDDICRDPKDIVSDWSHHWSNGTLNSALQLVDMTYEEYKIAPMAFASKLAASPFITKIIPACVNYYETANYIFVHGWIPHQVERTYRMRFYRYMPNWRHASALEWENARWPNGMELACREGIIEDGKTIVCGHWHCSWGHTYIHRESPEWGPKANFTPFHDKGIIAIDTCTAYTKKVNCLVLEDNDEQLNNC